MVVPDGYVFTVASTDINYSYGLTTGIFSFKPDGSCHCLWHDIHRCRIDGKLPQAEFDSQLIFELTSLGNRIRALGVRLNAWAIDGSGVPFEAVTSFSKVSVRVCGISSCAFLGRANHTYSPFTKSRLRDEIGKTVLAGDAAEHLKSGAGKKYVFWNADYYKELLHKAILAPLGAGGTFTLYNGHDEEHSEFSIQVTNEKLVLVQTKGDGRHVYHWRSREPHDFLDAAAQAMACAASQGISGGNVAQRAAGVNPRRKFVVRRQVKIV